MGRPKKNAAGQDLTLRDGNQPAEDVDMRLHEKNGVIHAKETDLPFELEGYASMPIPLEDNLSFLVCANTDIEMRRGRMSLPTGIVLKDGYRGLIMPTADNAAHGLLAEKGCRLSHSDVISTRAEKNIRLVLNIADDTSIHEQTNFGSRSRNLVISQGTPLAELILFKL